MAASIRLLVRDPRAVVNTTNISNNVINLGGRPRWTACRSVRRRFGDGGAADRNTTTHFGFRSVPEAEKAQRVYEVFESVAQKYDVMNDVMSLGVHRLWKDTLLRVMNPRPGQRLLDVAGGTGDVAFRFLDYVSSRLERRRRRAALRSTQTDPSRQQDIPSKYYYCASEEQAGGGLASGQEPSRAVVCDINKEMLKVGKRKADRLGISGTASGLSWVVGDAEELPFDDDQFDVYTVAFGIRNVTRVDRALREALRVLKPGGRFMCLEFSKVTNPLLARLYDAYSFQMIPVLGEVIAGDWKSYQYLVESIRRFPDQETLKCMIEDAGFHRVQYRNLTGGVVALHSGFKL